MTQISAGESKLESFSRTLVKILVSLGSTSLALILLLIVIAFISLPISAIASALMTENVGTDVFFQFVLAMSQEIWLPVGFTIFAGCLGMPLILFYVALFGFPASLIGWHLGLIRKWNCVIVGFFLGGVPYTLLTMSNRFASYSSSSSNGIFYWINGFPTLAGIIQLLIIALIMGIFGAMGGYVFWKTWSFLSRHQEDK